jgi:hypothetical protein
MLKFVALIDSLCSSWHLMAYGYSIEEVVAPRMYSCISPLYKTPAYWFWVKRRRVQTRALFVYFAVL